MDDSLAQLHKETYSMLAKEYEDRVEALRPVTEYALSLLTSRLKPKSKVLDIGCAVGYTVEILSKADMIPEGIDISPAMIKFARKRNPHTKLVVGDYIKQKYPENYFDAVLMYAFIHLFPIKQAELCIDKTAQILKPGGLLFICTTKSTKPSEGFESKADYNGQPQRFRKKWTGNELESVLKDKGFKVVYKEDVTDVYGKIWMDYVVKKA